MVYRLSNLALLRWLLRSESRGDGTQDVGPLKAASGPQ